MQLTEKWVLTRCLYAEKRETGDYTQGECSENR